MKMWHMTEITDTGKPVLHWDNRAVEPFKIMWAWPSNPWGKVAMCYKGMHASYTPYDALRMMAVLNRTQFTLSEVVLIDVKDEEAGKAVARGRMHVSILSTEDMQWFMYTEARLFFNHVWNYLNLEFGRGERKAEKYEDKYAASKKAAEKAPALLYFLERVWNKMYYISYGVFHSKDSCAELIDMMQELCKEWQPTGNIEDIGLVIPGWTWCRKAVLHMATFVLDMLDHKYNGLDYTLCLRAEEFVEAFEKYVYGRNASIEMLSAPFNMRAEHYAYNAGFNVKNHEMYEEYHKGTQKWYRFMADALLVEEGIDEEDYWSMDKEIDMKEAE